MLIRPLQTKDLLQWQALWLAYLEFYSREVIPEVTEHLWRQFFADKPVIYAFVAENEQGELVGFAHCLLHPNTWHIEPCCYLEDLYVASQARVAGLGRALIDAVKQFALQQQCHRLYWTTDANNKAAQALYEQVANRMDSIEYRINLV